MTTLTADMAAQTRLEVVTLVIPCLPDYVSVARLMIAGVASRLPFSADVVEDIRMAVSEVCTDAVDRASVHDPETVAGLSIELICIVNQDSITIEILDHIPPHA